MINRERKWLGRVGCLLLGSVMLASSAGADEQRPLTDLFEKAEAGMSLRYRFESVDDSSAKEAEASTLRTVVSLRSGSVRGFSFFLEAENVAALGNDDSFRNAGSGVRSNGVIDRPVVADVEQTELNQAYVQFSPVGGPAQWKLTAGRRELNVADQRFIGAVGWRQNHQSFDAFTAGGESGAWSWDYAYLAKAHRIFGDSAEMGTHSLGLEWDGEGIAIRAYALELDYDDPRFLGASTRTAGLELRGAQTLSPKFEMFYELEAATQSDTGDNPNRVSAGYQHALLGLETRGVKFNLAWERLEGAEGDGSFSTPLATLHKFNGWADKFLATPVTGLEDLSFGVAAKHKSWSWTVRHHTFSADSTDADYGTELDLSGSWKSAWGQTFAIKFADYQSDGFSTDTTKWMAWTSYSF